MKIAVVLGSHRTTGKNKEIADAILQLHLPHEISFIRMAQTNISSCTTCYKCAESKACVLNDDFPAVFEKLKAADAIFVITPLYAPYPSRLTALFERLTSFLYATNAINTDNNPLLNKQAAVFCYCSAGICDDTQLKMLFQKFVMKGYSFTRVNYPYINNCPHADEVYHHDIVAYVKDVFLHL